MPSITDLPKRMLLGRAMRSDRLHETLLPKRIALPVFASDALSSVSYATEEILLILSLGGIAYYAYTPWIAAGVVVIMLTVVASYRQNVHAYPSGGGDYEVATVNLGPNAGLTVASALLVDYVLTVAVSVSAAVANIASAIPWFATHKVGLGVGLIVLITALNLRGVRESGVAFAIPTYAFMAGIFGTFLWAAWRVLLAGDTIRAESAEYELIAEQTSLTGLALAFLLLRSFSSGCTALTGVEAISNGVPAFRKPKSRNAATTLLLMGVIAIAMFSGVTFLARYTHVIVAEYDRDLIGLPPGEEQKTVIAQVANAVFSNFPIGFMYVSIVTALILVLAANTAFNGFPVLGSILARDGYLPRQLHTRGDRLAFSNGIVMLAAVAAFLMWAFSAEVTRLIQLYIVGVFVSFTLSQAGMIRHWNRHLANETDARARQRMRRSQAINACGCAMTGTVLVIVLVTKFRSGAWIVCVAMPVLFLLMRSVRRHYDRVRDELAVQDGAEDTTLPSRTHAVVLVSKIHKPTLRALAYARATRPSTLTALTVKVDDDEAAALQREWDRRGIPVPLTVLDSPYREVTNPIVNYVKGIRRAGPRDVVTVFIPEYVLGHWWENLLHNQSALRLKGRLLFTPGVMVTSVPWQLQSSSAAAARPDAPAPGLVRRAEFHRAQSRAHRGDDREHSEGPVSSRGVFHARNRSGRSVGEQRDRDAAGRGTGVPGQRRGRARPRRVQTQDPESTDRTDGNRSRDERSEETDH